MPTALDKVIYTARATTTGPGGHSKCSTYGHPNCSTLAMVI